MTATPNSASSPLVLAILDGVGLEDPTHDNALAQANAPFLHAVIAGALNEKPVISLPIQAHGVAVGLPSDADMGNSEVGHNIMGAGRIFDQGAKQVEAALASGDIWGAAWQDVMAHRDHQIHFVGLLSDGNVHSHIRHLIILLNKAAEDGASRLVVHALFDGRDVIDQTAEKYLAQLNDAIAELEVKHRNTHVVIGSAGGRMNTTMDRYEADWTIVQRGWEAHAVGTARPFQSAEEALATLRAEDPTVSDQYLPSFTIVNDAGSPVGRMNDNDAVVLFNFRGDRMVEIYRALAEEPFTAFPRGPLPQNLLVVGMTMYDGDLGIPAQFLVPPTRVTGTVSELLAKAGIAQMACAETQKYGHVTYFWNGNRSDKFNNDLETYIEIPSDKVPFDQLPRMKAAETGDEVVKAINSGKFPFIRCNFAGGDMVGHTGNIPASVIAVEAIDEALIRVNDAVKAAGGTLLITADHGNCEVLIERDKSGNELMDAHGLPVPKKSHTLSPVPFVAIDYSKRTITTAGVSDAGISNVAATILVLLGQPIPADYRSALLTVS
jgi:2,3-bisphosphoglycerate-independent phosphoglycerate mutase